MRGGLRAHRAFRLSRRRAAGELRNAWAEVVGADLRGTEALVSCAVADRETPVSRGGQLDMPWSRMGRVISPQSARRRHSPGLISYRQPFVAY